MRSLLLCLAFFASTGLIAQSSTPSKPATNANDEVRAALVGDWVGVLEYRDYHEPATSLTRVDLPTWLAIRNNDSTQTWHFVYDDGPGKTVDSTETVLFDTAGKSYQSTAEGKAPQTFAVEGFEALKQGHGVLVMDGNGADNGKPADVRLTLTIRRNLMELLQEVRPSGTSDAFSFRHLYRMVRSIVPRVTQK